jgi:hypothetical protein
VDALRVVVDGYGKFPLGRLLANYVLIQKVPYFQRLRDLMRPGGNRLGFIILKNGVANRDALITDVGTRVVTWRRNQFSDDVLALVAEGTSQGIIRSGALQMVSFCSDRVELRAVEPFPSMIVLSPETAP